MKKLVIMSDTHGKKAGVQSLKAILAENDYIVHLGDGAEDMKELRNRYPEKTYACVGNCDLFAPLPEDGVLEVENVRIFYCHGHRYGVKNDLEALASAAKARDCQIALYGHTHLGKISEIDGVTLINPGTMRYAPGKGGSYCYLVVNKDQFTPVIVGDIYA